MAAGSHLPILPEADPATKEARCSQSELFVSSSWKRFVEDGD